MSRHDIDLTSLLTGLVFLTVGVAYLFDATGSIDLQVRWVVPLTLIGLGVAGLAGALLRVRQDRPAAAEPAGTVAEADDEPTTPGSIF